jgi:glycosyltransferase involved in cell wall biosynthesis
MSSDAELGPVECPLRSPSSAAQEPQEPRRALTVLLISAAYSPDLVGDATHVEELAHGLGAYAKEHPNELGKTFVFTSREASVRDPGMHPHPFRHLLVLKYPRNHVQSHPDSEGPDLRPVERADGPDIQTLAIGDEDRQRDTEEGPVSHFGFKRIPSNEMVKNLLGRFPAHTRRYVKSKAEPWIDWLDEIRRPDIIHAHSYESAYLAALLRTAFGIPVILTLHRAAVSRPQNRRLWKPMDMFLHLLVRNHLVDRIVVPSDSSRDYLAKEFSGSDVPIDVIRHGISDRLRTKHAVTHRESVDAKLLGLEWSKHQPVILCPVRDEPIKQPQVFFDAMPVMARALRLEGITPFFVMTTKLREGYPNEVAGCKFRCAPFDYEEMGRLYELASVCIVPAPYESFGLVALESFLFGKPVIGVSEGGIGELVKDRKNGLLFSPTEKDDLARLVVTLLTNHGLYEKLSRGAVESWREHSRERMVEQYVELYRTTLTKKSPCGLPGAYSPGQAHSARPSML